MEEIRKVVPWPLLNISTVSVEMYMVVSGVTFSFNNADVPKVVATFSGSSVTYTGDNIKIFVKTLEKLVENEGKKTDYATKKLIGELKKDRNRYKKKYKQLKDSIKYAPGGEEFKKAEADFYRKAEVSRP
nr:hypothetical protein MarFTME_394 [Marseillevirus futianmevirus]